ncbi:MAG TPA: hypothetical protein PKE45_04075 [Caldilineaceae bacterium]|nr:hypothetical protein [Caldilineaceae bacterium]
MQYRHFFSLMRCGLQITGAPPTMGMTARRRVRINLLCSLPCFVLLYVCTLNAKAPSGQDTKNVPGFHLCALAPLRLGVASNLQSYPGGCLKTTLLLAQKLWFSTITQFSGAFV